MYQSLLFLHLFGAVLVAGLVILALLAVVKSHTQRYTRLAKYLGISFGVQLLTGSLLTILKPGSVLVFCARISVYLFIILATEYVLYRKLMQNKQQFPWKFTGVSGGLGIVVSVLTLFTLV